MIPGPARVELRDRIGGRWAVSWVTYLVVVITTGIPVAFHETGTPAAWAAITVPAAAAACAVLWLADVTVLRRRRVMPVAPALVVAIGALAGVARAAVMVGMASALGVTSSLGLGVAFVGSILFTAVTVVVVATMCDAVAQHRRRQAALVARMAALQEMTAEGAELAEAMRDAAVGEMMVALDATRRSTEVPVGEMSADDRLALAGELRRTVDEQLRPLSHRLYASSRRLDDAHLTGWRAFIDSLRAMSLFPLTSAFIALGLSALGAEYAVGPVILALAVWLGVAAVVAVGRRSAWMRRYEVPVGAIVAGAMAAGTAVAIRTAMHEPRVAGIAIVTFLAVGCATLCASLVGTLLVHDAATARLADEVDARQLESMAVNRELARTSRDLAQYVHGTLQASLLTTALAVEEAVAQGDDTAFTRAVADARAALGDRPAPEPGGDLTEVLARTAHLWRGFVDVQVVIDPGVDARMAQARVDEIGRIVGEAVANARKHGRARHVEVRVSVLHDGDLGVVVTDDGTGPAGGVQGMGSAWLDFIAPGAWHLGPGPRGLGATLEVRLPQASPLAAPVPEPAVAGGGA